MNADDSAPRPVPAPPKQPLTKPIPVVGGSPGAQKKTRRRRRGRGRLPNRAIVFVGPMAAGKTSLGRRVAKELNVPFVDSDVVFQQRHGAITDFFAIHGEDEFRRIEAEIIAEQLAEPGLRVLALGGGAVLTESTRTLLKDFPVVLLMTTQAAVLRTANLARRPLLRDDPEAWGRILEARRHLYVEVADITFRTDRATKEQLVRRVVDWARGVARREARRSSFKGQRQKSRATKQTNDTSNRTEQATE
ncbi:MAG: shikimate kinase [Leucobacter sp.]|nr:shikimate kinase [Leucobacter sp.]